MAKEDRCRLYDGWRQLMWTRFRSVVDLTKDPLIFASEIDYLMLRQVVAFRKSDNFQYALLFGSSV